MVIQDSSLFTGSPDCSPGMVDPGSNIERQHLFIEAKSVS